MPSLDYQTLVVSDLTHVLRAAADMFEAHPEAWTQRRYLVDSEDNVIKLIGQDRELNAEELVGNRCRMCGVGAVMAHDKKYNFSHVGSNLSDLTIWIEEQFRALNVPYDSFFHFNDDVNTTVYHVIDMLRALADRAEDSK